MADTTLVYEGCNYFRLRLVLATLGSRPVRIKNIRTDNDNPGLRGRDLLCFIRAFCSHLKIQCLDFFYFSTDFEANFIRLMDKLTNGSHIEVNETGR